MFDQPDVAKEDMQVTASDLAARVRPTDAGIPPQNGEEEMDTDLVDDAAFHVMLMSMGVDEGPYKRERRAAAKRVVSEIYSPPRVTRAISSMPDSRLTPGFALDMTCIDPDDGQPWDFDV